MKIVFPAITVNKERLEEFIKQVTIDAVESVEKEAGCLQFDVNVDPKDETKYYLYEVYADDAAFEHHMTTPHFKVFKDFVASGGCVIDNVKQLT